MQTMRSNAAARFGSPLNTARTVASITAEKQRRERLLYAEGVPTDTKFAGSLRDPSESVPRLCPGGSGRRPKSLVLNTKMVGGPGFEPGASRSRTVLVACPPVSRRLPRCPPELKLPLLGVRLCPPRAAWCRESVPRLCPGACLKRRGPATTSH